MSLQMDNSCSRAEGEEQAPTSSHPPHTDGDTSSQQVTDTYRAMLTDKLHLKFSLGGEGEQIKTKKNKTNKQKQKNF